MSKLVYYREDAGCGATIELDSREICILSVARTGVLVRTYKKGVLGALFGSFFGAVLFRERAAGNLATTALMLTTLCPEYELPIVMGNVVLRSFANAIWQSRNAAEFAATAQRAREMANRGHGV